MDEFTGKVAVVTGAGSGIGRGMAMRFAREGMRVAVADIEQSALSETVAQIRAAVPDAAVLAQVVDVTSWLQVRALADSVVHEWGAVDLLCNNAGVFVGGFLWERSIEDFEFVLGVNLYGILHGIRAFVPRMIAQGTECHVVNTSSIGGVLGSPYAGPYGISKFAAFAATESLAGDLIATGSQVRAHVLCPGSIRTRIAESERNRPPELVTGHTEDQDFVEGFLADTVATGLDPEAVGEIVLDALGHPDQFLILTHPELAPQISERGATLAALRLPGPPDLG